MGKERGSAEETIKTIRRKTRRQYAAEEKIRIVMEGLRGEEAVATILIAISEVVGREPAGRLAVGAGTTLAARALLE